jgi:hypothetical protein
MRVQNVENGNKIIYCHEYLFARMSCNQPKARTAFTKNKKGKRDKNTCGKLMNFAPIICGLNDKMK